jgi:hypothetical protein
MAYKGYLIKVGDYKIPANKFIKADSYSPYVNMQDLDPWTDANGYLHRNAVDLKALKVEFETPAMLTNYDLEEFLSNIRRNYTNLTARECMVEAYIPEYNDYVTQKCYLADFTPQIYSSYGGVLRYNPIRFAFIGGLADD